MTDKEALELLNLISAYDRFQPLPDDKFALDAKVKAWKLALDMLTYERAEKAVVNWYREKKDSIAIADIISEAGFGPDGQGRLVDFERLEQTAMKKRAVSASDAPTGGTKTGTVSPAPDEFPIK